MAFCRRRCQRYYCWVADCPRGPNGTVPFAFRYARDEHAATAHGLHGADALTCLKCTELQDLLTSVSSGVAFRGEDGPARLRKVLSLLPALRAALVDESPRQGDGAHANILQERRWPFNTDQKDSALRTLRARAGPRGRAGQSTWSTLTRQERAEEAEAAMEVLSAERAELKAVLMEVDKELREAREAREYQLWAAQQESEESRRDVQHHTAADTRAELGGLMTRLEDGLERERARERELALSPLRHASKANGMIIDVQLKGSRAKQGRLQHSLTRTKSLSTLLDSPAKPNRLASLRSAKHMGASDSVV